MQPSRDSLALLFENAPGFVERLAMVDASGWEEFFERAEQVARDMPDDEQVELLNAHPRIGAPPSSVSALSYREQGYQDDRGSAKLQSRLDRLNADYEARFGFRFVVFVNGRSRDAIADALAARLAADRDEELQRGLSDVIAIARDRQRRMEGQ
jgi:2-oxo-4-hydroxy-4-carboxy--5-ureidoimidazoline (OHCU) decarboxylase